MKIFFKIKLFLRIVYFNILFLIYSIFGLRKGTLVYLGVNTGESFIKVFYKYKKVYAFEPNPNNYNKIKYLNNFRGINIFQKALSDKAGKTNLYIPSNGNNSASGSLSKFTTSREDIYAIDCIEVETINLLEFIYDNNIIKIDKYISDIEGFDFKVLHSIFSFIKENKIDIIQVEAVINGVENPFEDCDNYEINFDELLNKNYNKIGRGWGNLKAGQFEEDRKNYFLIDLLYQLKQ